MKELKFEDTNDFSEFFKQKNLESTNTIVSGIREAFLSQKKTAKLFEVSFDQSDYIYEISLSRKEWKATLESCLEHYHEWEMSDEAIDTWQLLEQVKIW